MLGKASHLIFLCLCFIIQKTEGNNNSCSWSCLRMKFPDIGTAPIPAPSQEGELSWLLLCRCLFLACLPQLPGRPVAAVTNYQKHGSLKPHTSFSSQLWRPAVQQQFHQAESKMSVGPCSLGRLLGRGRGDSVPCLCQLLVATCVPWLVGAWLQALSLM